MVENRPWIKLFYYVVLSLGVLVVVFPLWVTFVASTLTLDQILAVPMPLLPGDQLWANYAQVLGAGAIPASFVASVSADGSALVLKPIGPVAVDARRQALELWAVPGEGAPRSCRFLRS